tara:strand:+ start:272 stop:1963 length:1692 start_codon:yes stop_codon:yes gene_type:complete
MSFDFLKFAEGFVEARVERIEKAEGEATAFEDRQRALAERNAQTVSKRNAVVSQVVGLSNMLRSNGASERVIQAAISAGPQEVATLANKVEEARKIAGRSLGEADIEALVNVPENFSIVDMKIEDLIKKTYGLGYEGAGVTDEKTKRSLKQRFRGEGLKDAARERLDSELMQGDLTAYDINQIAAQKEYDSLVPGTFITFNDLKVFNPAKDMATFTRTMNNLRKDVEDSGPYAQIEDQIADNEMNANIDEATRTTNKAALIAKRDKLYLDIIGPTVISNVEMYGETFLDATGSYLRSFLSSDYVDSLALDPTSSDEDMQTEDAFSTGVTTPKVDVSLLPDVNMDEVKPPQMRPKLRPDSLVPRPEETSEVSSEVEPEEADPLEITQYISPLADAADSALGLSAAADTAQLNIDNQKTMAKAMSTVTRAEWDDMTRAQRKEKGLPVRKLDLAYAGKDNFKKIEKERVKSIQERALESFGNVTAAKLQEDMDRGLLTELDLQIVVDYGSDIIDFIRDDLYPTGPEGIIEALSDWAEENEKTLPMDKSFLVKTLGRTLKVLAAGEE